MKRYLFLALLLAAATTCFAGEGFFQGTIDQGLQKAKADDKLLFLKFYSDT